MFESRPQNLPCAQHDKFETERTITQLLLKKCPGLLELMMIDSDMKRPNARSAADRENKQPHETDANSTK